MQLARDLIILLDAVIFNSNKYIEKQYIDEKLNDGIYIVIYMGAFSLKVSVHKPSVKVVPHRVVDPPLLCLRL